MKPHSNLSPIILLLMITSCPAWAVTNITKTGDTVVESKALTLERRRPINGAAFQQDAVASHKGHQYVTFWDADRQVCVARRKLPAGDWAIVRLADYAMKKDKNDVHNTISLGICPKDGTIHLSFDHHGGQLKYRVSRTGVANSPEAIAWDASLFGPIKDELEKDKPLRITYPRFWQTPDGGLQFGFRRGLAGRGDRFVVDYDAENGVWVNTRQIDAKEGHFDDEWGKSDSRGSYPNGYTYGPDGSLHVTWVWREGDRRAPNHDLMYAYSEDLGNTWLNNRGQAMNGPLSIDSSGIKVVDISRGHGLMNTHGQAVDSLGRIHVVMWHTTDQALQAAGSKPALRGARGVVFRYQHHWRDTNAVWHHTELPVAAGTRPKVFVDDRDNVYVICSDAWTRGIYHHEGDLMILGATSKAQWKDWKTLHVEKGPFINEMLGDYYRWKRDNILSVMVQESPKEDGEATPLRILDFAVEEK